MSQTSETSTDAGWVGGPSTDPVSQANRGVWAWVPIAPYQPPSMETPESEKGETYHAAWTRYFLSRQSSQWINYFRSNYDANTAYAIDSRWGESSDIRMFLGDGPEQTSRIPFKFPIMSPMLTRMVGAVDSISIEAYAEPATQYFAQTRKEQALQEAMLMSSAAAAGPAMAEAYAPMGVSPDPEQTESLFDMNYQDHIERGANSLMAMLAERSHLKTTKREIAAFGALSGIPAIHCFINGNNIEAEVCEPSEIGWDTSAKDYDFQDGQFAYVCPLMDVGAIGERWNPVRGVMEALDKWARILPGGYNFNAGWPQSRPRVFTMYWKDYKYVDRGYVIKDGELEFCTIGEVNPDTGKPDYTDRDLQTPPVNIYTEAWTEKEKREKKQRRCMQVLRYCSMIPWEYLPGGYTKGIPYRPKMRAPEGINNLPFVGVAGDIVLEYGVYPLQEADPDDVFSVKFPLKMKAWRYLKGMAVAPMTAATDPQRWMNQITSDIAWRMRKAGGNSVIIAKEAVDASGMDERELQMKVKEGDTLILPAAQLNGIPQMSGNIDSSPGASFYNMVSLLPTFKDVAESAIGVPAETMGAPTHQDQLVGTLQLQLQQAGVMQQPFYACIADVYRQVNQFFAQAGKQFYARRPWLLQQMTGTEDMQALIQSKDMQLEQFRVKIDLGMDSAQLRLMTDQSIIPNLMQLGMLDPLMAAQLMGRSLPRDVYAAARKYTKQAAQAATQGAQAQQQAAQQQAMAMEEASIRDEQAALAKDEQDAALKMAQVNQKMMQPMLAAEASHFEAQDPSKGITL